MFVLQNEKQKIDMVTLNLGIDQIFDFWNIKYIFVIESKMHQFIFFNFDFYLSTESLGSKFE